MTKEDDIVDILIVDDDPDDTELTTHALLESDRSIHLKHLNNGLEALNFIFGNGSSDDHVRNDIKLVLIDLKLPKIDGLGVLKKIRSDERTFKLPVVILTSSREKKDIMKAYDLGVNSYVVKPVGFEKFVKSISTLAYYWTEVNVQPIREFEIGPDQ